MSNADGREDLAVAMAHALNAQKRAWRGANRALGGVAAVRAWRSAAAARKEVNVASSSDDDDDDFDDGSSDDNDSSRDDADSDDDSSPEWWEALESPPEEQMDDNGSVVLTAFYNDADVECGAAALLKTIGGDSRSSWADIKRLSAKIPILIKRKRNAWHEVPRRAKKSKGADDNNKENIAPALP